MLEIIDKLHIETFNTSQNEQLYMAHYEKQRFEINENVFELISAIQRGNSWAVIAQQYSSKMNKAITEKEIQIVAENCLQYIKTKKASEPFLYRKELMSGKLVKPFTNWLQFLYVPKVFYSFLSFSAFLLLSFFLFFPKNQEPLTSSPNLWITVVLYFCSVVFHELGHASAGRYFGAEHGGIGFALYLYFPVFYADITDAWKLSRYQRVLVDIGGMYFQGIFLIPLIILYFFFPHYTFLHTCIYGIVLSFLVNLNPFFKFDGYWLLSDLLGVPNLQRRAYEVFDFYLKKLLGKKTTKKPFIMGMRNIEKVALFIYSLVMNLFFAYFFLYRIPLGLYEYFIQYPTLLLNIQDTFVENKPLNFTLYKDFLVQTFFFFISIYFLFVIIKFCASYLKELK